jgi:hypothetical protein
MVPVSLEQSVRASDATVFRELDGEAVLLQLDEGMYYGLDPVGTRLWQLMLEHGSLQRVFDAAIEEFEVTPANLRRDLSALVSDLVSRKLLVLSDGH